MAKARSHSWRFKVRFRWADRLIGLTRLALSPDREVRGYFHGTSFWLYKRWTVKAMAAIGRADEAMAYAEGCRGPWASDTDIDGRCEQILLSLGRREEAYARYGLSAHRAGTYLAWFRTVQRKYSGRSQAAFLADLVRHTPGEEGKWFASATRHWLRSGRTSGARRLAADSPRVCSALPSTWDEAGGRRPACATSGAAVDRWHSQGYASADRSSPGREVARNSSARAVRAVFRRARRALPAPARPAGPKRQGRR